MKAFSCFEASDEEGEWRKYQLIYEVNFSHDTVIVSLIG